MRGSDFKHWHNWLKRNGYSYSYDEAREIYDEHFSCNCMSCAYRKEHGFIPIPTLKADCTCPVGTPKVPSLV